MSEEQIVSAALTAVGKGPNRVPGLAQALEKAMNDAVLQALADGVPIEDSARILDYKARAYSAAKARFMFDAAAAAKG